MLRAPEGLFVDFFLTVFVDGFDGVGVNRSPWSFGFGHGGDSRGSSPKSDTQNLEFGRRNVGYFVEGLDCRIIAWTHLQRTIAPLLYRTFSSTY